MRPLWTLIAFTSLALASAALAGPPARPADDATRARTSFEDFASQWMSRQRGLERHQPRVSAGPGSLLFTYRDYADGYRTELAQTGRAQAPYVGFLHYTEELYSCRSLESRECTLAASVPLTEIFRFREGRWGY